MAHPINSIISDDLPQSNVFLPSDQPLPIKNEWSALREENCFKFFTEFLSSSSTDLVISNIFECVTDHCNAHFVQI